MPVRLDTCTGTELSVVVPLPSSPTGLAPHAHAVPSARTAKVWRLPPLTWATLVNAVRSTGEEWLNLDPLPNCPSPPRPHPLANVVPLDPAAGPAGPSAATAAVTASTAAT